MLQDTHYVVAHFHYVPVAGSLFAHPDFAMHGLVVIGAAVAARDEPDVGAS